MVLDREDEGVGRSTKEHVNTGKQGLEGLLLKGIVPAGLDNLAEEDLGGEGEAVVDDRLAILTVPTVH